MKALRFEVEWVGVVQGRRVVCARQIDAGPFRQHDGLRLAGHRVLFFDVERALLPDGTPRLDLFAFMLDPQDGAEVQKGATVDLTGVGLTGWPHLLLPRALSGQLDEVHRQLPRLFEAIVSDEVATIETIDPATAPGLIVVDNVGHSLESEHHFQMYLLMEVATESREGIAPLLFRRLLTVPWGPLALLGQGTMMLRIRGTIDDPQRTAFLAAMVRWWPLYRGEGERYTTGLGNYGVWSVGLELKRELARRGLRKDACPVALPNDSLGELLALHPEKFADVLALIRAT